MSGQEVVLHLRGAPEGLIHRPPLGEKSWIFVHQSPGNELPGYYHGAPPGLTIANNPVILAPMSSISEEEVTAALGSCLSSAISGGTSIRVRMRSDPYVSSAISGDASTRAKMRPDPYVLTCASLGAESSVHFIVSPDRLQ
jgi:hypothetical protein